MRWRNGLLTASSALLVAGCGSEAHKATPPPPRIPSGVASKLAAEAEQVAALTPGTCEARDAAERFRADVIASIGRVPARYQEPLTSAANTRWSAGILSSAALTRSSREVEERRPSVRRGG